MISTDLEEEPAVSQLSVTVRKPSAVVGEVVLVVATLLRLVLRTGGRS